MDCANYAGGNWVCGGTVGATFVASGVPAPALATSPYYENGYTAANTSSAYFNGVNSYFDAGDVLDQTGDMTVCAARKSDATAGGYLLSKYKDGPADWAYLFYTANVATSCSLFVAKSNVAASNIATAINAGVGAWSVCCGSYDFVADGTSILRINQDGVAPAEITNAVGPIRDIVSPLRIGASSAPAPLMLWNGSIARVTMWNVAFTTAELNAMVRHYMGMLSQERYSVTVTRATTAYEQPFPQIPTGLLALMPANVLRVESAGALFEPLRINLALRSEAFDTAATWVPVPTALDVVGTANTTAAPTGYVTADSVTDLSVAAPGYRGLQQTIAVVNASKYGYSVYAKYKDYRYLMLTAARTAGLAYQTFDIQNGAVGATAANVTNAAITPAGNGFYRCMFEYTADAGSGVHSIYYDDTDDIAFTHVGVVGNGTYLFGAQLELGNYTTSYVGPTAAVAVQRNADAVSTVLPLTLGQNSWAVALSATPEFNREFQTSSVGTQQPAGLWHWVSGVNYARGYTYPATFLTLDTALGGAKYREYNGAISAAAHSITAANLEGAYDLRLDGTQVGAVVGAGTGLAGAIPTTINVGSEVTTPTYWGGNIKNFTLCASGAGYAGDWARCTP
jgi:hypothetical protein